MNEELGNIYASVLEALMAGDSGYAGSLLDGLDRKELDEVFERAYLEQVAREDLREMALNRVMR